MKKHKINKFGEHYFLGVNQDNKKVYLEKASWECDCYWGFGYLYTFTNNKNPEASRGISSHTYFDTEILNGKSHAFNNFKNYFKATPLTDDEIRQLCDYMSTYYTLKKSAEVFEHGYSYLTPKAKLDIIKNNKMAYKINFEMLPALFEETEKLLTRPIGGQKKEQKMKRGASIQKIRNIEKVLNVAKEQGALMTIITRENILGECWGWILTKNKNLLYVQNESFGRVSFWLAYMPSRENGSGCRAGGERQNLDNIDINTIEQSGLRFANELNAKLFTDEELNEKVEKILSDENNVIF